VVPWTFDPSEVWLFKDKELAINFHKKELKRWIDSQITSIEVTQEILFKKHENLMEGINLLAELNKISSKPVRKSKVSAKVKP
jgi:hypothetical protein